MLYETARRFTLGLVVLYIDAMIEVGWIVNTHHNRVCRSLLIKSDILVTFPQGDRSTTSIANESPIARGTGVIAGFC